MSKACLNASSSSCRNFSSMLKVAGKKYGDEVAERKNESTIKMVVYPASLPRGEFLSTHFAGLFSRRRAILSLLMRLLLPQI